MAAVGAGVRLSPVAYLQQEETATTKSEYLAGELFPMAGGTSNHNRIAVSACSMLDSLLEVGRCEVFNSDLKVWVEAYELFTYPAAMVVCGPTRYFPDRTDAILNPTVIVVCYHKVAKGQWLLTEYTSV